jgi:chromosome segregation ATPase
MQQAHDGVYVGGGFPTTKEELDKFCERENALRNKPRGAAPAAGPVVDSRDPGSLKMALEASKQHLGQYQNTLAELNRQITDAEARLSDLLKLKTLYAAQVKTRPTVRHDIKNNDGQIADQEAALAGLKIRVERLTRIIAEHRQGLEKFKKSTPHKDLPTNEAMIKDYIQQEKLEQSAKPSRRWW